MTAKGLHGAHGRRTTPLVSRWNQGWYRDFPANVARKLRVIVYSFGGRPNAVRFAIPSPRSLELVWVNAKVPGPPWSTVASLTRLWGNPDPRIKSVSGIFTKDAVTGQIIWPWDDYVHAAFFSFGNNAPSVVVLTKPENAGILKKKIGLAAQAMNNAKTIKNRVVFIKNALRKQKLHV